MKGVNMAIEAITSVTNKGYTNISFGKREKKSPNTSPLSRSTSSTLKAVPLAVMIAMRIITHSKQHHLAYKQNRYRILKTTPI